MRKTFIKLLAAGLLAGGASAATAATLIIDNGILTGATGINVGGTLYNVSFVDGTCANIYGGCNAVSDFDFFTAASANVAAQALLDQVFLDGSAGNFDSISSLVRGCGTTNCNAVIPYAIGTGTYAGTFIGLGARNYNAGSGTDSVDVAGFSINADLTTSGSGVFTRFSLSPSVSGVPEPSTWAMMQMGFGAMGISLRRRKRSTSIMLMA